MPTTNVGLVTGPVTPSSRSAPRTNVVLPAPSSPETSTTSPGDRVAASSAPARSVASALEVRTAAQGDAGREEHAAGERDPARVDARARELLGRGRGRLRGRLGRARRRRRRGRGLARRGLRRCRGGRRGRLRLGLLVAEGVLVLLVPGALREGRGGRREGAHQRRDAEQGAGHRARQCIPRYLQRPMADGLHILVLTDRDWTHPQGGGTGTNLYGQVARWIAWGHRVTVVAGSYPGAAPVERPAPNLELHRMGGRVTVFPRAAAAVLRGVGREADVVLEVVNGITFLTPLWLRKPRVAM